MSASTGLSVFCAAIALFLSSARQVRAQANPYITTETQAEVYKDHIRIYFPLPFERIDKPSKPFAGFYAWMFSVESPHGFSIVVTADTALRTSDLKEIMKHSTLRLCSEITPTNVRTCHLPVKGTFTEQGSWLNVEITDTALVSRVTLDRPQNYWRYLYEPNGRFRIDRKFFSYRDRLR